MKKKGYISNSFVTWAKRRNIPVTYKTVVLVPYYDGYKNVLTQDMIDEENIKYVIKHDYWLNGETITVPENSVLEFDGGILHDGTIIGQDTSISDIGGLGLEKLFAEDIVREGTWRTNGVQVQSDWKQNDNTKPDFIKNKPTLANIATSGSYNDLVDAPVIPAEQIQSDWNQTNSRAKDFIKSKPRLAPVATSGNYKDLSNKPTIPEEITVDTELSKTSTNPVQNKIITKIFEKISNTDKSYDPTKHSGLGRKTLKLKEDDNILVQNDFNQSNTIYIISYDFNLGEETIDIPEGCILDFEGGSIDNGTLIGNNTSIDADSVQIFGDSLILKGSFNVVEAYPEWFGAKGDGITDDTDAIKKVLNYFRGHTITFSFGKTYPGSYCTPVFSNTEIVIDGTLTSASSTGISLEFFDRVTETPGYSGVHDVIIRGIGTIDAAAQTVHTPHSPLRIHHCKDITIRDITCKGYGVFHFLEAGGTDNMLIENVKFFSGYNWEGSQLPVSETGDVIQLEIIDESSTSGAFPYDGTVTKNVTIRNCTFTTLNDSPEKTNFIGNHQNNAIHEIAIENCKFYGLQAHSKERCIRFLGKITNLSIKDCYFENFLDECPIILGIWDGSGAWIKNVNVKGCQFKDSAGAFIQYCDGVNIENNVFYNTADDVAQTKNTITLDNDTRNISIKGNVFKDMVVLPVALSGVLTNILIEGNSFRNLNSAAIYLNTTSTGIVIKQNMFSQWGTKGDIATANPAIWFNGAGVSKSLICNNIMWIESNLQRLPIHIPKAYASETELYVMNNIIFGLDNLTDAQYKAQVLENLNRFTFFGTIYKADSDKDVQTAIVDSAI